MAIAICGHGDHGKGTVSRMLSEILELQYTKSTSRAAAELVFSRTKETHSYASVEDCWEDRRNHRDLWDVIIARHNKPLGITLYADMIRDGEDIIDGIRRIDELSSCRSHHLVQCALWIDASQRKPSDPTCSIIAKDCDITVDNNGTLDDLLATVQYLARAILPNYNAGV